MVFYENVTINEIAESMCKQKDHEFDRLQRRSSRMITGVNAIELKGQKMRNNVWWVYNII